MIQGILEVQVYSLAIDAVVDQRWKEMNEYCSHRESLFMEKMGL